MVLNLHRGCVFIATVFVVRGAGIRRRPRANEAANDVAVACELRALKGS